MTKPKAGYTIEQKAKTAARKRARYATPEGREKARAAQKAQRSTAEAKTKAAAYNRIRMATPEAKAQAVAQQRAYKATPEGKAKAAACTRASKLMREYGITIEQYDLILVAQDGRCAICKCVPRTRRLAVDHCHKTKMVRGLLCTRCNHHLLGAAHDKPEILRNAIRYLESPPADSALLAEEGDLK